MLYRACVCLYWVLAESQLLRAYNWLHILLWFISLYFWLAESSYLLNGDLRVGACSMFGWWSTWTQFLDWCAFASDYTTHSVSSSSSCFLPGLRTLWKCAVFGRAHVGSWLEQSWNQACRGLLTRCFRSSSRPAKRLVWLGQVRIEQLHCQRRLCCALRLTFESLQACRASKTSESSRNSSLSALMVSQKDQRHWSAHAGVRGSFGRSKAHSLVLAERSRLLEWT